MDESEENSSSWRNKSIRERLHFALNSQILFKDVAFIVGREEEVIGAHKLIVRLSSLVLHNLIQAYEELGTASIPLPNVTPTMFRRLLKFIYTDELEMHDFVEFLRVGDEFGFTELTKTSLKVLRSMEITENNLVFILQIAKDLIDLELEQRCLVFIQKNAGTVLKSEEFVHISYMGLSQVLLDDKLVDADELTIFKAAVKWATFSCKQRKLPDTEEYLRDALQQARFHIRYTEIPYENLLSEVKSSGILSSSEFIQVLKTFIDPTDNPLGLTTRPRIHQRLKKDLKLERAPVKKRIIGSTNPQGLSVRNIEPNHHAAFSAPLPVPTPVMHPPQEIIEYPMQPVQIMQEQEPYQEIPEMYLLPPPPVPLLGPVVSFNENPDESSSPEEYLIQNCSIDFHHLLATVLHKQSTLRRIIFNNVTLLKNNGPSQNNRVFLPHLKSFQFFQDLDPDPNSRLPDTAFKSGMSTKEFLFFEKSLNVPWLMSNLLSLGVFISVDVKGITLFEINPTAHKVTLAFPDQVEADFILENCNGLRTLCLVDCDIKTPMRINAEQLVNVILQGVRIKSMSGMRFINRCSELRNLSLNEKTEKLHGNQVHFASDFKKCKHILERLSITNATLFGWSVKNRLTSPGFDALQELYFNHCTWTLVKFFREKFPNLKRFAIRSRDASRPTASFLREVLQIQSLERVAIFRYPGLDDTSENPNLDIFDMESSKSSPDDKQFIHELLQTAGLEFPLIGPGLFDVPDFIMTKDEATGGVWKILWEDLEHTHLNFSMLNEVFADISVLHKLNNAQEME